MFKKYLPYILISALFAIVYRIIFSPHVIAGGDYESYTFANINNFIHYSFSAWENKVDFGWSTIGLLHGAPLNLIFGWIGLLFKNNIYLTERLVWWIPFILLSFVSSTVLFNRICNNSIFKYVSSIIYAFNTYVLLIIAGGQIVGIGLAYAIAPIMIYAFINLVEKQTIKNCIIFSLALSLVILFDLRIAYILLIGSYIYFAIFLIQSNFNKKPANYSVLLKEIVYVLIAPAAITSLMHAFWLIPLALVHQNPLDQFGSAFTTTNAVQYFSFAKFENAISLLHPNWPENIFGKTYFMRPEFLILPILAFSSLFSISRLKDQKIKIYILFFALLGIIGAFLAKGANDPFGGIYLWMFNHVPGFVMFRDSTKWYLLVALSYSILIPFTVSQIYEWLKSLKSTIKNNVLNFQNAFLLLVVCYLLFLIRPALLGQLGGTFKSTTTPSEYLKLESFLSSQGNFSRTLWVPTTQRFGFYSEAHPEVSAQDFLNVYDNQKLLGILSRSEKLLQESGVKYVIIPYDSQGEIFLTDRAYDNKLYMKTVNGAEQIPWLKQIPGFGKIAVFEVPAPKDHLWSSDSNLKVKYKYINPTKYEVNLSDAKKGDVLVFSESYDSNWTADKMLSVKYDKIFNSFILSRNGSYTLEVYYKPQDYVSVGLVISATVLIICLILLLLLPK